MYIRIYPLLIHNLCSHVHFLFVHVHICVCICVCYCIPLMNDKMSSIVYISAVTSVRYLDRLCVSNQIKSIFIVHHYTKHKIICFFFS